MINVIQYIIENYLKAIYRPSEIEGVKLSVYQVRGISTFISNEFATSSKGPHLDPW